MNLIEFYEYKNLGMNCGKHMHIDNYIEVFNESMEIMKEYK